MLSFILFQQMIELEHQNEINPIQNFQNISLPNISEVITKNSVTLVNEEQCICSGSLAGYIHLT